jgi:hypothetical protein
MHTAIGAGKTKLPVRRSSDQNLEDIYTHMKSPRIARTVDQTVTLYSHRKNHQTLIHIHILTSTQTTRHLSIALLTSNIHTYTTTMPPHHQEYDAMSTMSTTSTLVPPTPEQQHQQQQQRTTLTGRPIEPYSHDALSNMFCAESFQARGNTLPPGYTDSSLVHIPIKTAEYLSPKASQDPENDPIKREPKKASVFSRLSSKISHGSSSSSKHAAHDLRVVSMSRGDYLKYWAKGEDGEFLDSVVEPPGGRAEWLTNALERQEREGMAKAKPRRTEGMESGGVAMGGIAAVVGNFA